LEYRRPIRTLWAERIARRSGLRGVYRRRVDRVFRELTPDDPILPNSLAREGFAATQRDATFHSYKSFAGSRVLQTDGGRVWLTVRHGIQVGDIEAESPADLERSARALEQLAARLGVHQIVLHGAPATRFQRFFAGRYGETPSVALIHRDVCSQIPA